MSAYIPLLFALLAALSLGSAYTAEYGFGLKPCELCLYQRVPFAIVIGLGLIATIWREHHCLRVWLTALIALSFEVGAGLAVFHAGVEYGWWDGFASCSGGLVTESIEALKAHIMGAAVVRCDEAAFRFLGLSMAGWNVLWSGALALLAAHATYAMKKELCNAKTR